MKVILYLDDVSDPDTIKELVSDWVTGIADRVGVNRDHIAVIGIATDETYAKATAELFGNSSYTNNNGHTGVGKCKTCFSGVGTRHTILFHVCVLGMILEGASKAGTGVISSWAPETQLGPFVIAHELGHCRDNELRPSIPVETLAFPHGFDLERIHDYYLKTLCSEIGACLYADRYYSYEFYLHIVESEKDACTPHQIQFEALKVSEDSDRVYNVALHGASLLWLYIIQLSKIIVGKLGTPFESEVFDQPFANLTGLEKFHPEITRIVTDFCNSYPDATEKLKSDIVNVWNEMSLKLGLRYHKRDEGWECYWT